MFPQSALSDEANELVANAKLCSQFAGSGFVPSGKDLAHLFLRQLRGVVRLSARRRRRVAPPSLIPHVLGILSISAQEQVVRTDTEFYVTVVADLQPRRDGTEVDHPGDTMRQEVPIGTPKVPVSLIVDSSTPEPASLFGLVRDSYPEGFVKARQSSSHGGQSSQVVTTLAIGWVGGL